MGWGSTAGMYFHFTRGFHYTLLRGFLVWRLRDGLRFSSYFPSIPNSSTFLSPEALLL